MEYIENTKIYTNKKEVEQKKSKPKLSDMFFNPPKKIKYHK